MAYRVWRVAEFQEDIDPRVPTSVCIAAVTLFDLPRGRVNYVALMGERIETKLATVRTIYMQYMRRKSTSLMAGLTARPANTTKSHVVRRGLNNDFVDSDAPRTSVIQYCI
jgi:hypothetical protein